MTCQHTNVDHCTQGHKLRWRCHQSKPTHCKECDLEEERKRKLAERDFRRQQKLAEDKQEHERRIQFINEQIRRIAEDEQDRQLAEERRNALLQRQQDLDQARQAAIDRRDPAPSPSGQPNPNNASQSSDQVNGTSTNPPQSSGASLGQTPMKSSPSEIEWTRQKHIEGASSKPIDELMAMTGLEKVKEQVLKIKAKVETAQRQGTNLRQDRFGISLLGNPGTGKYTHHMRIPIKER